MLRARLVAAVAGAALFCAVSPGLARAAPGFVADESLASGGGSTPAVAFAPNGFAVAAWKHALGGNQFDVAVAVRPPGGPWSVAQELGSASSFTTAPSVAVNANGDAAVAWQDSSGSAPYQAVVSSRPASGTFRAPENIPDGSSPAVQPGIGIDSAGEVTLLVSPAPNIATRTFAAGSPALAAPSQTLTSCSFAFGPLRFAEAPSGDAAAGYTCSGAGFALRTSGTWKVTAPVADASGAACMPGMGFGSGPTNRKAASVAIDSQGHAAALMETDSHSDPCPGMGFITASESLLLPVSGTLTVAAGPPVAQGTGSAFGNGAIDSAAVGVGAGLVVTWASPLTASTGSPYQVHARFFDANGGNGSAVKDVGAQGSSAEPRPALAVGLDGHALLAWAPNLAGQPLVVAAARAPGGDFGAQTAVSAGGDSAFDSGAAIDDAGDGVVTYALTTGGTAGPPRARGFDATSPTLGAVSIPAGATAGTPASFSAAATDFWGPLTFAWSFGDGGSTAEAAPSHVFGAAGAFTATVTATDAAGNSASTSGSVQVAAAPPPPPPPPPAPVLTGVAETHARFRIGLKPTAVAAAAKRKRAPVGTTFLFTLNEPASVALAIDRLAPGRRSGRRCVKPSRRLHKRCTRILHAGTLTRGGLAGANRVPFSGRVGRRKLALGAYRVKLTPTAGGKTGVAKTMRFKVVR